MTNDQKALAEKEEVFLGPTTAETDEFYAYQRDHPGMEKAEYLQWFEGKFGKEIELRRRRSDQPSDLEYMVIKKRSKYRERIGIESEKLVSYYESNPKKTYRELASWFQKQFGKEIDITAISRALKRSRASEASADSPPDLNSSGPSSAKRGRRSYNSIGPAVSGATGPPSSSIPTFFVDISNNRPPLDGDMNAPDQPRQITPHGHGGDGPHYPNGAGPRDESPRIKQGEPVKAGIPLSSYPNRIHQPLAPASHADAPPPPHRDQPAPPPPPPPPLLPPQTPVWATVNNGPYAPKPGKIAPKTERHSTVPPQPREQHPPQVSPARSNPSPRVRVLRSNSLTKGSGPPPPPPGPPGPPCPPGPPGPPAPAPQGHQAPPPRLPFPHDSPAEMNHHHHHHHHHAERCNQEEVNLEALRARLAEAARKQAQAVEEVGALEAQVANCERANIIRQHEMEIRRFKGIESSYAAERERMINEILTLKGWNADLERGNLEMQGLRGKFEHDIMRLIDERNNAIHALRHHEAKLYTITQAFEILGGPEAEERAAARTATAGASSSSSMQITSPSEYDHRARKDREDLDAWVNKKFAIDASNEDQLKGLVEDLTKSELGGLENKIRNLVGFVNQVGLERQRQQAEWTSKLFSASHRDTQTPEADKSHGSYSGSDKQTPAATTTAVTTPQERSPIHSGPERARTRFKPDPHPTSEGRLPRARGREVHERRA